MTNRRKSANHPPDIKEKNQKLAHPPQDDFYKRGRRIDNLNPDEDQEVIDENDEIERRE